jgi:hypothetical protein
MPIKYAEQKIKEARQRVAALDRELADLRRQSRKVAKSRRRALCCWRCASSPHALEDERCRAYGEVGGADRTRRDAARIYGLGVRKDTVQARQTTESPFSTRPSPSNTLWMGLEWRER